MKKGILLLFLFILWNGAVAQPKIKGGPNSGRKRLSEGSLSSVKKVLPPAVPSVLPPMTVKSTSLNSAYVRATQQELKDLYAELNRAIDLEIQHPFIRSTFQAHNTTTGMLNTFSGTVFKTEYEGKKEIWLLLPIASAKMEKTMLWQKIL